MNQNERLDYLVKRFLDDSGKYKDLEVADDLREKRTVLRSLMNIRMPGLMDEESLRIQDAYLTERITENGIVDAAALPAAAQAVAAAAAGNSSKCERRHRRMPSFCMRPSSLESAVRSTLR